MAESQDRKVSLTGSNLFCYYTHGVADTSLVSLDACPDSHYPVLPTPLRLDSSELDGSCQSADVT
jgi:hypothetical protein